MEHKAVTKPLHSSQSWAICSISFYVLPAFFISSSMFLGHVPSGLPLLLFPGGIHRRVMCVGLVLHIWRTGPSHLHCLFFTSSTMQQKPARLFTSLLVTCCSHRILRILRRQRPSKPLSRLSSPCYKNAKPLQKMDMQGVWTVTTLMHISILQPLKYCWNGTAMSLFLASGLPYFEYLPPSFILVCSNLITFYI